MYFLQLGDVLLCAIQNLDACFTALQLDIMIAKLQYAAFNLFWCAVWAKSVGFWWNLMARLGRFICLYVPILHYTRGGGLQSELYSLSETCPVIWYPHRVIVKILECTGRGVVGGVKLIGRIMIHIILPHRHQEPGLSSKLSKTFVTGITPVFTKSAYLNTSHLYLRAANINVSKTHLSVRFNSINHYY